MELRELTLALFHAAIGTVCMYVRSGLLVINDCCQGQYTVP